MSTTDRKITGVIDDGHEAGVIRTKDVSGDFVIVPFRRNQYRTVTGGTTVVAYREEGTGNDPAGIFSAITVDLVKPASGTGTYAEITHTFYGRKYGLKWMRPTSSDSPFNGQPNFAVIIDGVIYQVINYLTYQQDQSLNTSIADGWNLVMIADDLSAGPHEVRIVFYPDASGTGTGSDNYFILQGYLVEKRVGYLSQNPVMVPLSISTLTTSFVNFPNTYTVPNFIGTPFGNSLRTMRKILYFNTLPSGVSVNIAKGNISIRNLYLAASGLSGDSVEFDLGSSIVYDSSQAQTHQYSWSHKATSASGVNFMLIGGS